MNTNNKSNSCIQLPADITVKLHEDTISEFMNVQKKINENLFELVKSHLENVSAHFIMSMSEVAGRVEEKKEQLYNMKELSNILNLDRRTLAKAKLPFKKLYKGSRKMYSLPEVKKFMKMGY